MVPLKLGNQASRDQSLQLMNLISSFENFTCLKSAQIRSFFWSVFSRIRTEYGEIPSTNH